MRAARQDDDIYKFCFFFFVGQKREKSKYFKMNRSTYRYVFFKNYLFHSYIWVCFRLVVFIREHLIFFSGFVWVYTEVTVLS